MDINMHFTPLFIMIIIHLTKSDTEIHGKLFGHGVCSILRTDMNEIPVSEVVITPEESWELCWNLPPWCKVVERYFHEEKVTKINIPHYHLFLKCCPGFKRNSDATACLPACSPFCESNSCIDVNVCTKCIPGYSGSKCLKENSLINQTNEPVFAALCECPEDYECNHDSVCVCVNGLNCEESKTCLYYTMQVAVFLFMLLVSFVVLMFVIKKGYCFSEPHFEPLDNSYTSSSHTINP